MQLPPGSRLGPYEIAGLLGAGGMGEVYRARDPRLGRDVAVKVLPPAFADDRDRLHRFEQEARATAALNDPNIVAIYDVGTADGRPYVVTELLDGETLRAALSSGALPLRKALAYALQIVRGLAAAHRRGIAHRDLKPENVFVAGDGLVKILDFGLAKLSEGVTGPRSAVSTTAPGLVLGTVGYMSPEQAKGELADHRADIFSFGAVLYEMLSGQRAFQGDSPVETLSAILKEQPPDLTMVVPGLSPGLARIVDRCLEKNRDDRFQTAADLRFALESISGTSTPAIVVTPGKRWPWKRALAAAGAALALAAAFMVGAERRDGAPPRFHQLTFRRGAIQGARFTADGQTIVYAAAWEGGRTELFSTRPESPEARPLQMAGMGLFAMSAKGEMAVVLEPRGFGRVEGTLARAPLAGGVPRQLANSVLAADWNRDGSELAIVRSGNGKSVLEFPVGTTLYDPSPGNITHIRVSPTGDAVAVIVHPVSGDTAGSVVLVDLQGRATTLSSGWNSVLGLAWAPAGDEIWFTATRSGAAQALHAVSRSGRERQLLAAPATLTLHDVAADGRVLVSRDAWGAGVMVRAPEGPSERDLSWLDGTTAWDLSTDGRTMVLEEAWEGGGAARSIYLRTTDGAPALRLGEGVPLALSPDGQWVISTPVAATQLVLLPTGVGQSRVLPAGPIASYFPAARFLPDGRRFLVAASEKDRPSRIYLQAIDGGEPRAITPEGVFGRMAILPDGQRFVTRGLDRRLAIFSLDGGEGRPVAGAENRDLPIVASPDGDWLYVQAPRELPAEVARVHLRTGRRELVRSLLPPDPAGTMEILRIVMTPDARAYVYTFVRALSALYLVDGLDR
jgi:eukaryotic-like serine/threonine-protein kinase